MKIKNEHIPLPQLEMTAVLPARLISYHVAAGGIDHVSYLVAQDLIEIEAPGNVQILIQQNPEQHNLIPFENDKRLFSYF